MSLRTHDRVDATLRRLTARSSMRDLTRSDVEDMLWAIRQLNERNVVVRDVLNRTDDSILSEKDIERMEETLDAVRNLYRWVAETSRDQDNGRPTALDDDEDEDAAPTTIRAIARQYNVSIRSLRQMNPSLDDIGADDTIPANTRVKVPRRSRGFVRTLRNISKKSGVPIRVLRRHNPDANEFADDDVIPKSLPINVPVNDDAAAPAPGEPRVIGTAPRHSSSAPFVSTGTESLRTIAEDIVGMSILELRDANPDLDEFEDDERLPPRTKVIVEAVQAHVPRSGVQSRARSATPRGGVAPPLGGRGSVRTRDDPDFIATGRETFADVADILGVHVHALLAVNDHLINYSSSHRVLPVGTEVFAPMY